MGNAMYSVYRKPDDIPVVIHKNRVQCAAAMGLCKSLKEHIRDTELMDTGQAEFELNAFLEKRKAAFI